MKKTNDKFESWEVMTHYDFPISVSDMKLRLDAKKEIANAEYDVVKGSESLDIEMSEDRYEGLSFKLLYEFWRRETKEEEAVRLQEEKERRKISAQKAAETRRKKKMKNDPEFAEYERLKQKFDSV